MKILKNLALSDTGFVFNPSTGDSFSVNPIGLGILKDFKDGKSEDDIKKRMMAEYQTDKETIEKDLYDFMKMIEQFNLTEYHEQA
ncbi:MAG: PqqD family protein [Bacteroidota bacterium]